MKCPKLELHFPEALPALWELLGEGVPGKVAVMGGGTDLLVRLKQRILTPSGVVGLDRLKGMHEVRFDPLEGLALGACVRLVEIGEHPDIREHYPDLASAARQVASAQVRNIGTLGGTLCQETRCAFYNRSVGPGNPLSACLKRGGDTCHAVGGGKRCYAAYQGDLAPVLLARGAEVKLRGPSGTREVAVDGVFSGDGARPLALKTSEIVTSVRLPAPGSHTFGAYRKFRLRDGIDFPLAGAAATAKRAGKGLVEIRVALTGVGPSPVGVDLGALEAGGGGAEFFGKVAAKARAAAHPVANLASSPAHRRKMVEVMVTEMLFQLAGS